jgi:hypothetical protein
MDGVLLSNKEVRTINIFSNMAEPQKHAKWKKPNSNSSILWWFHFPKASRQGHVTESKSRWEHGLSANEHERTFWAMVALCVNFLELMMVIALCCWDIIWGIVPEWKIPPAASWMPLPLLALLLAFFHLSHLPRRPPILSRSLELRVRLPLAVQASVLQGHLPNSNRWLQNCLSLLSH